MSKWWDGFSDDYKIVVLDDLDSDCLAHYLKIWADKWAATGESKGSTVALNYEKFIVTSNYSISHLMREKGAILISALTRRFKEIYMGDIKVASYGFEVGFMEEHAYNMKLNQEIK